MKRSAKVLITILVNFSVCVYAQSDNPKDSARSSIDLGINAGGGLVRNTLAPEFNLTATFDLRRKMQFSVNLSSVYFFEREGNWKMYDNYFLGLEFMFSSLFIDLFPEHDEKRTGFGISYLVGRKGDIFPGTTMKFYLLHDRGVRLRPELYMTNDFKTFFPGIAVVF